MAFRKGYQPWNRLEIDETRLVSEYQEDRQAIRRLAKEWGCTIYTLYNRLKALGIARRSGGDASIGTQARENNPNWKGGRWLDAAGYIVVNVGGHQIREHRIIAEKTIARKLKTGEVIHHLNGDRADNRPENIEVLPSQSAHMKKHMTTAEARRRGRLGGKANAARAALEALK